ncbi:LCP family protein [Candidatus Daviesbacteria bacterium]|nr:LCP family protein [Candidatus Daviesbacteria bacterium]
MHKIKFAQSASENPHQKKTGKVFKKLSPVFVVIFILTFGYLFISTSSGFKTVSTVTDFIAKQQPLLIFQNRTSVKSTDNKTNILLLGNPGGVHAGPYLTDTVMVASLLHKENKVYLISLPRDLWVDQTKTKLNAVYELGSRKNNGLEFSKKMVGDVLGIPIHYAVRADFRGFIKAIDELGDVEVSVDRTFDDYNYPISGKEDDMCGNKEEEKEFNEEEAKKLNISPGKQKVLILAAGQIATDSADPDKSSDYFACRFEHIHYEKGLSLMDGEEALIFVRSRKGTNGEGSDFARSKRQQKVLESIKAKVLSFETLTDPKKISLLIDTYGNSVETDIPIMDILEFYKLVKKIESMKAHVVDNSENSKLPGEKFSVLVQPRASDYGGAYVLVPRTGRYDIIHEFVNKILSGELNRYEATTAARVSN